MSETILKLLAKELALISIKCPNKECGAIIEANLAKLPEKFSGFCCPVCCNSFIPPAANQPDHIKDFARALQGIAAIKGVDIRIIVPIEDKK